MNGQSPFAVKQPHIATDLFHVVVVVVVFVVVTHAATTRV